MTTHRAARRLATTLVAAAITSGTLLSATAPAGAATVPLSTAAAYAVVAYSTVTNTGPSVINGSVGLSPNTSVTGFGPGIVVPPGTIDIANGAAAQAQADVTTAYTNAQGRSITATTGADLANAHLGAGVYAGPSHGALRLTGPMVLDGAGDPRSVFVFQTDSSLTTFSGSTVSLVNGAQACNVFWQVGSSATLGTGSVFAGNILALASVTVTTGVTVHGRAFARTGAVTLDTDLFTRPSCDMTPPPTTTTTTPGGTTRGTAPGGGPATTQPGGGTATTQPGGVTPTLPGTPPGRPGVPGVNGPPQTGGAPLPRSSFPWLATLLAAVLAAAALGAISRVPSRR